MRPNQTSLTAPHRTFRFSSANTVGTYYDAASTANDSDFGGWRIGFNEEFLFNGRTRFTVLGRLRREIRNNPYLAGLVAKFPEAIGKSSLRSRTSSRVFNSAKEELWHDWAKRCTIDDRSLRSIERINAIEQLIGGELFIVKLANGRIQLISSEYCGSPGGTTTWGEAEINGVVYDSANRPIAYRFGHLTRYGAIMFEGSDDELVSAKNVIHVFEPDRVLMGRGIPWILPSVKTFRDLYEITRSKTKQIKDANSLSGFIEKQGATEFLNGADISGNVPDPDGIGADPNPESGDSPADPTSTVPVTIELRPGMFFGLEPGEKVNSLMSEYHATDYKELIMLMLHAGSAPIGLPVELWFSGLGNINYSGFKGLGVQWKNRREYICDFIEETLLDPLQEWRCKKAQDEGDLITNPDNDESKVEFGWKRSPILDDEKAAKGNQIRLVSGEASLADIFEENGDFVEEVFAHRRDLWIKAQIASGELADGSDHSKVKVPIEFILQNLLPGETPPKITEQAKAPAEDKPGAESP